VIAAEQRNRAELVSATVPERDIRQFASERAHDALMCYAAEGNYGLQLFHLAHCRYKKITTGFYFFRRWFVFWRHAAHRVGDPAVDQLKSIVGMRTVVTARKAELDERVVKQHAGMVARERTAGSIGALQAGREADDQ